MTSLRREQLRPLQTCVDDLVLASPGLAPARSTLAAYASLTRPILLHGEITTVRALLPPAFRDRLLLQIDCSGLADAVDGHGLSALLRAHQTDLTDTGLLVLFEIDRLRPHDLGYLGELARHGVISPRGDPMSARLICQLDHRLQQKPLSVPRGVFLEVEVPPLRARREDAVQMLCALLAERIGKTCRLSDAALEELRHHDWPSDLPELVTLAERLEARKLVDGLPNEVRPEDLDVQPAKKLVADVELNVQDGTTLKEQLAVLEAGILRRTLKRLQGNKSQAARELGISRSYLIQKCRDYAIG